MNVLLVHAHPDPASFSASIRDSAIEGLRRGGHEVRIAELYEAGNNFVAAMSAAEREAYSSDVPILDDQVRVYADDVRWAQALVFVYPTWWFGMPAILKGFLDRVLVPGVAFVIDPQTDKVKPGMTNIRRLVGITTYGSPHWRIRLFNDSGRRTLLRTLRLVAHRFARSKWLAIYQVDRSTDAERQEFLARVERELAKL